MSAIDQEKSGIEVKIGEPRRNRGKVFEKKDVGPVDLVKIHHNHEVDLQAHLKANVDKTTKLWLNEVQKKNTGQKILLGINECAHDAEYDSTYTDGPDENPKVISPRVLRVAANLAFFGLYFWSRGFSSWNLGI